MRVISGGQTGVDEAALAAAKVVGWGTGGTMPPRFLTSRGPAPWMAAKYGVVACDFVGSVAAAYAHRSRLNVDAADATLVVRLHASTGTDRTIGYCATGQWGSSASPAPPRPHRPCMVVTHLGDVDGQAARLAAFLVEHSVGTLNVAGHRDPDLRVSVGCFLTALFRGVRLRRSGEILE